MSLFRYLRRCFVVGFARVPHSIQKSTCGQPYHKKIIAENQSAAEPMLYDKMCKKEAVQSFLLCIGSEVTDIQEIYVYFDKIKYTCKSFIRVVDILFKIFHVFNVKCPD